MTRRWTAKTFQDCAANAKKGGGEEEEGGAGGGGSITITTNVKYLKKTKARKSIKRFFKYIYIIPPASPFPALLFSQKSNYPNTRAGKTHGPTKQHYGNKT